MVFQAIADCLDQPLDRINNNFKSSCVSVLGNVAANYEIRSRALPYVWKALMDYGSPSTRSQAIEATVNMFDNDISPPPNLVEMILISLTDQYVVVHQAALRAVVRRPHWFSTSQTPNLFGSLAALLDTYATERFRVKEIWHAMVRVARVDPRFKIAALRLVEKVFPTGEESVDQDIVSRMIGFYEPTEAIAGFIAKCVAVYLGEHRRDSINNFGDSEREQMLAWLRQLPIVTFRQASDDLLKNALKVAERDDVWGACNFAGIFAHFACFQRERDVLGATLRAIPDEPRRAKQRALIQNLTDAAAQNASLQADEIGG